MTLISRTTLSGTAASVTFSSIPQTFQTLKIVISSRSDRVNTVDGIRVSFNGSTSSFTYRDLTGSGSAASSGNSATGFTGNIDGASSTSSTFGSMELTIPNYAGSTNKPWSTDAVMENNATAAYQNLMANLWSNTAAIASIVLTSENSANFVSGSTFSLYGVS